MKAVIIGAGLGGLLAGARLLRAGYNVELFERLPFIGGRFANLDYKGFRLSTGALHMIPHGERGPLARMLQEVGADTTIITSKPAAIIRIEDNNNIVFRDFRKFLTLYERMKLIALTAASRVVKPTSDISFEEWASRYFDNDFLFRLADSFCGWALSLAAKDVPAREILEIIHNMYRYGGPGVPAGGCGAVTAALADVIRSEGGIIHTKTEVDRIVVEKERAAGIRANGITIDADIVISDIGHLETSKLYDSMDGEYFENISQIRPSRGVKICLSSDEQLIGHNGVLFTPFADRINGINEVTNADPSFAPEGKHLIMSHQTVLSDDLEYEIKLGLHDLERLFPGRKYDVLMIQSYSNGWPVNRAPSGNDFGNRTPVSNLFIVGDGAKGKGGMEVEGVALGVRNMMRELGVT